MGEEKETYPTATNLQHNIIVQEEGMLMADSSPSITIQANVPSVGVVTILEASNAGVVWSRNHLSTTFAARPHHKCVPQGHHILKGERAVEGDAHNMEGFIHIILRRTLSYQEAYGLQATDPPIPIDVHVCEQPVGNVLLFGWKWPVVQSPTFQYLRHQALLPPRLRFKIQNWWVPIFINS